MARLIAYKPLARFGRVYYLPTTKGFMFYDKRTKTALATPAFAVTIFSKYKSIIKPEGEWYLPKQEITINNWACRLIETSAYAKKHEKELFYLMGFHYTQLGRPKEFWEGLINIDKRFELYTLAEVNIDQKGSIFSEKVPMSMETLLETLPKLKGEYLTENLIKEFEKKHREVKT